jgi:hypothetical protein
VLKSGECIYLQRVALLHVQIPRTSGRTHSKHTAIVDIATGYSCQTRWHERVLSTRKEGQNVCFRGVLRGAALVNGTTASPITAQ